MNIRVIQTGIKQQSLQVSSIIPSLKQIGSQVSWHMTILNICLIASHQQSSLPWIMLVQNKFHMSFNKPTGCGNILKFHPNRYLNLWENGHQNFRFLIYLWRWIKVKVIQTDIKMYRLVVSVIIPISSSFSSLHLFFLFFLSPSPLSVPQTEKAKTMKRSALLYFVGCLTSEQ